MRINMRKLVIAALTAFSPLFTASAWADEYVFNVPIRIENASGIVEARIRCGVTMRSASGATTGAEARETLTIAGGAYNGTLRLVAPVPAGSRREDATHWFCTMTPYYAVPSGVAQPAGDVEDWYEDLSGRSLMSHNLRSDGYFSAR
jgi:hypothetical protein